MKYLIVDEYGAISKINELGEIVIGMIKDGCWIAVDIQNEKVSAIEEETGNVVWVDIPNSFVKA